MEPDAAIAGRRVDEENSRARAGEEHLRARLQTKQTPGAGLALQSGTCRCTLPWVMRERVITRRSPKGRQGVVVMLPYTMLYNTSPVITFGTLNNPSPGVAYSIGGVICNRAARKTQQAPGSGLAL